MAFACAGIVRAEMPDFPYGCFARDYSDAHLASNPQQSVRRMVLHGGPNDGADGSPGFALLGIDVEFAAQGIGVEDAVPGKAYGQFFRCYPGPEQRDGWAEWIETGKVLCHAECDGGTVQIARFDGDVLDLRTAGFTVELLEGESDCGGAWLTDEGTGTVLFRLHRADPAICEEGH